MENTPILHLRFYKLIDRIEPGVGARISVLIEGNSGYLMPCELIEVVEGASYYNIAIILLDAERFASDCNLGKKFFFGPPGNEVGYGILESIR